MNFDCLDRPVWDALSKRQSQYAKGDAGARRFLPEIGPLASGADDSAASLNSLAELINKTGKLLLLQATPIKLPRGSFVAKSASGVQMIGDRIRKVNEKIDERIIPLTESDVPEMVTLAKLTKPGPFEIGTHQLGKFWGIKIDGRLAAMAGERLRHEGISEVSGVCVHPDFRGQGLARSLSLKVTKEILARGEVPYLHSYTDNQAAIKLYESLGFRIRAKMHVAALDVQ